MAASASGVTTTTTQAPAAQPSGRTTKGASSSPSAPPPSTKGQRATGDSILSAVDGEGVAPSLVKSEKDAATAAPIKQAPQKKGAADTRAAAAEAASTDSEEGDLEAVLQGLQSQLQPNESTSEPNPEEGEPLSEREQNRIQFLANRTKAAEDRAIASENQMKQMSARFEQWGNSLNGRMQQVAEQNARLQGQLQTMLTGQQRQQLSPEEQVEQDFIGKATTAAERKLMGHIQGLQKELASLKNDTQQRDRRAEININKARYSSEAIQAARSVVLAGLSEEVARPLLRRAQEHVLARAWSERTSPAEAAKMVREDFLRFGITLVRAEAAQRKQKKTASDQAPAAPPAQRSVASGEPEPTFDELRSAGFRGPNPFMDWDLAGRPALRR